MQHDLSHTGGKRGMSQKFSGCPYCYSYNTGPGTFTKERPFRGIDTPGHVLGCNECEACTAILPTREQAQTAWIKGDVMPKIEFWARYARQPLTLTPDELIPVAADIAKIRAEVYNRDAKLNALAALLDSPDGRTARELHQAMREVIRG